MFQQLISTWIPLGTALLRQLFPRFGAAPCHYINGPDTLPAPLTKEEEAKVMEDIRNGVPGAPDHPQPAAGGVHRQKV